MSAAAADLLGRQRRRRSFDGYIQIKAVKEMTEGDNVQKISIVMALWPHPAAEKIKKPKGGSLSTGPCRSSSFSKVTARVHALFQLRATTMTGLNGERRIQSTLAQLTSCFRICTCAHPG